MRHEAIVERLKHNFEQFGVGNRQPFLDFLADDVVLKLPFPSNVPWHGTYTGKDRMPWYLDLVAETLDFESFELLGVFGSGDTYAVHLRERVRVKSTGKSIDHDQIFLYRIKDSRIVEYQEFGDTDAFRSGFEA
jgi:ketosteroid isomerase-like protein